VSASGRIDLLGVPVDVLTRGALLDRVADLVAARGQATVGYVNVHVLDQCARNPDLAPFLRDLDVCYCDGKGAVLAARILGERLPERMTGADWIWDLAARAEGRWRLCWVGGEPGVTEEAARALRARHPALQVVAHHGFHPKEGPENDAFVAELNAAEADIVLVGMGTPVQERWVGANRAALRAPVVWCLGATADFVSGRVSRGPRWLYDRQEWLARLVADPRRLWRRYLLGNARVMARACAAATRRRARSR
jgi:N-acetylglucosaminyldiphosphoundecaprenol N-acetyl-beta-D-mannosaminyltransferase